MTELALGEFNTRADVVAEELYTVGMEPRNEISCAWLTLAATENALSIQPAATLN